MPPPVPDPGTWDSLLDVLDHAADGNGDRRLLSLRTDEGLELPWIGRELRYRSKLVAWRLRQLGLRRGDRLLTWSPSTPELPALYFGAMRAGVVVVPIDLRMTPEVVQRIAERAEATWLVIGTGADAPHPSEAGLGHFQSRTVSFLAGDPAHESASRLDEGGLDAEFPADWETQVDGWPRPGRSDLFEVVFTSGTTGHPKGAALTHGNFLATLEASVKVMPNWDHRAVSLLPLSHLFGQLELFYVLAVGADLLYLRSRNPRIIFEALREHRVTTMIVVPQVLELFWTGINREVAKRGKARQFALARSIARRLPYFARRLIFRNVHEQLGGSLRLFVCAAAFLPPALQEAWQDLGVIVFQGYGATECGFATAQSIDDHPPGRVGRTVAPSLVKISPEDGEILVGGPNVFGGYWRDPEATGQALDAEGFYHTGDIGRWDDRGQLILSGRKTNMIVLPNGFNVYPEDIENELRMAGLRDSVVVETTPGRIEAIVLDPDASPGARPGEPAALPDKTPEEMEARDAAIEAAIKRANTALGMHQRVAGWRLWPGVDFPRTHTLKVKRDLVGGWLIAEQSERRQERDSEREREKAAAAR
jgi:long-chain acyl-CoA synthetase